MDEYRLIRWMDGWIQIHKMDGWMDGYRLIRWMDGQIDIIYSFYHTQKI